MYQISRSPVRYSLNAAVAAALASAAPVFAPPSLAQDQLPTVHVIATGGTISNTGGQRRTGEELLTAIPGVERFANVTVEQFSNVASGSISLEHMRQIALRINEVYRTRPEVTGVVVTHGTDTLEETAYFLDLAVAGCKPVIVTGAMRQATAVGADGPANLLNSVRAAAAPAAASRGTLVLLNDEIFTARSVAKINTLRPDAFGAPVVGAAGVVDPDGVVFFQRQDREGCSNPVFDLTAVTEFPRVEVIYVYAGADSVLIQAAADAGAKGLVIAAAGAGATTPAQSRAIGAARDRGVFVLTSNRTGSGRVTIGRGVGAAGTRAPQIGAGTLNPQKARIFLTLALATGTEPARIAELLRLQ